MLQSEPITKSQFVRGYDCVRRPWLDRHRPDLKPPLTLALADLFSVGRQVGEFARLRYPTGKFVVTPNDDPAGSVAATQAMIDAGHDCLFEATVEAEGYRSRIDVLSRSDSGCWIIDEVKSSTIKPLPKIKIDKFFDLAFQTVAAKKAGLNVEASRLVLINSAYVWPGGDYSFQDMLGVVDATERCLELEPEVEAVTAKLLEVLSNNNEPEVITNVHCKKCDYFEHCHEARPENEVIHFSRINAKAVTNLRENGFHTIEQIPEAEKLTPHRTIMRNVIVSGEPHIGPGLGEALETIQFPAAFVDFESANPAFPRYVGTRPFQQTCFQWSVHTLESPTSEPKHFEFLAENADDPREAFCKSFWEIISVSKSIVHYSSYEETSLKNMADANIPLGPELYAAIKDRSVDLLEIVADNIYYEEFRGQAGIKVVLPVLVPSMSYKNLMIGDGQAAMAGFKKMITPGISPSEFSELRQALLDYCRQDTLAMVEIYWALQKLAGLK